MIARFTILIALAALLMTSYNGAGMAMASSPASEPAFEQVDPGTNAMKMAMAGCAMATNSGSCSANGHMGSGCLQALWADGGTSGIITSAASTIAAFDLSIGGGLHDDRSLFRPPLG